MLSQVLRLQLLHWLLLVFGRREVSSFVMRPWLQHSTSSVSSLLLAKGKTAMSGLSDEVSSSSSSSRTLSALRRLLDRQKADMAMTEALIKSLDESIVDKESFSLSTFASSLASGYDYGFVSRSQGAPFTLKDGVESSGPPANVFALSSQQFWRNLNAMVGEYKDEEDVDLTQEQEVLQKHLESLTLNSTAIWERETANGPIQGPFVVKIPYLILCYFLDTVFERRYVPSRFFYLETVARMPYFSYITMLHLYETLGFWRRSADAKRVHFAEEINEFHHLLIMESLGGDQAWWVRFLAQHSAIVYYIVLCILWLVSPSLSYRFSELLETHAVNTYGQFLDENEAILRRLPPPIAAVEYYSLGASDPFYAEIQTHDLYEEREYRSPGRNMTSLYDVFNAVRRDEGDHVATMQSCLDSSVTVRSPSVERNIVTAIAISLAAGVLLDTSGVLPEEGMTDLLDGLSAMASGVGSEVTESPIDLAITAFAGLLQRFVGEYAGGTEAPTSMEALESSSPELLPILVATIEKLTSELTKLLARLLWFI